MVGSGMKPAACMQQPAMSQTPNTVVNLCVGGKAFSTTLSTLAAVQGSYLATLFDSGRWQPSSLVPGTSTPFIDRDGGLFEHVLAYLRHVRDGLPLQQLVLPEHPLQLQQLQAEAEFYGLPGEAAVV